MTQPSPRTGMPDPALDRAAFTARFKLQFTDPVFDDLADAVDLIADGAWDAYSNHRRSEANPAIRPA